ncbi:MAG: hypothetical protein LC130_22465, partial [Bryobacterales bacterium]|nr:hypothetical protein [Bryobacterales bacterium]
MHMADLTLVLVDADRIHDFVFSPHQLRLIRGGSAIQLRLNEKELVAALPRDARLVFAGGGTVLAIFECADAAREYCRRASRLFYTQSAIATVTSACQTWIGERDSGFAATLEAVKAKLEIKKSARVDHGFTGSRPYWKICEACGLYPASDVVKVPEARRLFCAACRLRWEEEKSSYLADVNAKLEAAENFSSLAKDAKPEGYLALIYIDGDGMGEYLMKYGSKSPGLYEGLSLKVRDAFRGGVIAACAEIAPASGKAPFEILLTGGDDAIIMLQAHLALPFLGAFNNHFSKQPLDPRPTYSAGIVFAHAGFPIRQYVEHAEQLLRSAKRRTGEDTADFKIITEAMATSEIERNSHATAKPYSVNGLLALRDTVVEWKAAGVPRNKVNALYRMAYEGETQANLDFWLLVSRLEPNHKPLLQRFFTGTFWSEPSRKTKAADLVELWSFVQ